MTESQFQAILEARIGAMRETLASKATEYATGKDRLHNFDRSAGIRGRTPAQVCGDFMLKHITSIFDLTDKAAAGELIPVALIDEKIGDAINYLVLLEAILKAD